MITQTRCAGRPARSRRGASRSRPTNRVRGRTASRARTTANAPVNRARLAARARVRNRAKNSTAQRLRPGSPAEAEMVERYIPLVKSVVGRLAMTLPPHVDGEDLFSAGLSGLLNAVRQYNPKAGTSFETYARLRIRGSVLDELRRMDWVPRSVHTKARKVQAAMNAIEQKKGRVAREDEVAAALKLPVKEYQQWLEEIRPATFVCLDAAFPNGEHDDGLSQYESLADQRQENPLDGTYRREVTQMIVQRLKALPEMQRKVLALYYFEDMRLREIAEAFGLTESRICQIHAAAILNIKSQLTQLDPCFA